MKIFKVFLAMLIVFGLIFGCASNSLNQSKPVTTPQWLEKDKVWCPPPAPVVEAPKPIPAPIPAPIVKPAPKFDPIYFDFDKYNVKPSETAKLDKIVAYSKENPNAKFTLVGNCDLKGSVKYNMALGMKRAEAAKTYLVNKGVDAKKISTESKGKSKALAVWTATDRRVDPILLEKMK